MNRVDARERWEVVHDLLRARILSGDLQPGERILEIEMAAASGVSRGPVREAIRALEVEGLAVREGRRGSFVAALDPQDVDELYSFRFEIESFAIRLAMHRDPRRLLLALQYEFEAMRSDFEAGRRIDFLEHDLAFHRVFYEHSGHGRLLAAWQGLQDPLRLVLGLTAGRPHEDHLTTIQGHQQILEAVASDDTAACVDATRSHLERAVTLVVAYIEERSELRPAGQRPEKAQALARATGPRSLGSSSRHPS